MVPIKHEHIWVCLGILEWFPKSYAFKKNEVYRPARSDCQKSNKSVERPRKNENAKNEQAAHLIVNLRFSSWIKNKSFVVDQDDTGDAVEKVVEEEK